jgi:hypothetical protein
VKDFEKIEWSQYNRPPFYQQWLCRGDTLKLAAFGDKGLAGADDQILLLKDQWGLDNAKGHFLDRIGKILAEPRNGNNDGLYRLLLGLRTMLNTANGTVNDVIKVIKFLYGSEIVHIVPDYPAGLIILHDGEGPSVNFNEIIRQVVGAGIDYSTKELFYFTEKLPASETMSAIKAAAPMKDYMGYVFRNGVYKRNGQLQRRYSGAEDKLSVKLGYSTRDQLFGRSGPGQFADDVATETWSFYGWMDYAEPVQSSENASVVLFRETGDDLNRNLRRDGSIKRNGAYNRAQNVVDVQKINVHVAPFADALGNCTETMAIRRRKHHFHNGRFRRNGMIQHDSNIPLPLED